MYGIFDPWETAFTSTYPSGGVTAGRDKVTPSLVFTLVGITVGYERPLFATNSVSNTFAAFVRSDFTADSLAFLRWFRKTGIATDASIPMTRITTRSSMRVKPCSFSRISASLESGGWGDLGIGFSYLDTILPISNIGVTYVFKTILSRL